MRPNAETETRTGRRWARTGALLGGIVSLVANVTHAFTMDHKTVLAATVSVMSGLLWPSLLMVMTEVIIYNRFQGWSFGLKLAGFPPVAIIAAVSSYLHMSGLLRYAGESGFIATFGPLAIDGAMVLCSGALMVTRPSAPPVPVPVEAPVETPSVPVPVSAPRAVPSRVPVPAVHQLPDPDGLPSVPGLTRHRVSQVMAIRGAVPLRADRDALTWDRCGEILGITGRGALQKIHNAVRLMDEADSVEVPDPSMAMGGDRECVSV